MGSNAGTLKMQIEERTNTNQAHVKPRETAEILVNKGCDWDPSDDLSSRAWKNYKNDPTWFKDMGRKLAYQEKFIILVTVLEKGIYYATLHMVYA